MGITPAPVRSEQVVVIGGWPPHFARSFVQSRATREELTARSYGSLWAFAPMCQVWVTIKRFNLSVILVASGVQARRNRQGVRTLQRGLLVPVPLGRAEWILAAPNQPLPRVRKLTAAEKIQKEKTMLYTHSRTIKTMEWATVVAALLAYFLAIPRTASAQQKLELAGGWSHITGNFGQDGFNFAGGWYATNKVQLAADYDTAWHNSPVGTFQNTPVGQVTTHNHLQNWLFGPRIFFATRGIQKERVDLFGEAQFGWSHLSSKLSAPTFSSISTSDTAFTWMLGGGADWVFSPHWSLRGKLDFLRTHFASSGQSRLRLGVGVAYSFGKREK